MTRAARDTRHCRATTAGWARPARAMGHGRATAVLVRPDVKKGVFVLVLEG